MLCMYVFHRMFVCMYVLRIILYVLCMLSVRHVHLLLVMVAVVDHIVHVRAKVKCILGNYQR